MSLFHSRLIEHLLISFETWSFSHHRHHHNFITMGRRVMLDGRTDRFLNGLTTSLCAVVLCSHPIHRLRQSTPTPISYPPTLSPPWIMQKEFSYYNLSSDWPSLTGRSDHLVPYPVRNDPNRQGTAFHPWGSDVIDTVRAASRDRDLFVTIPPTRERERGRARYGVCTVLIPNTGNWSVLIFHSNPIILSPVYCLI